MQNYMKRHELIKDIIGIAGFIAAVVIGAALINQFLFRSFSVSGPSMETTLFTGDRLIVNRIPTTAALIQREPYIPTRGQVIVFQNPHWIAGNADEYIVKRVIAFPGERVVVRDGVLKVYNAEHPTGYLVDKAHPGPSSPTAGDIDVTVPDGELFVAGDHRQEGYSLDSRNGLGTVPYSDIIGPVSYRIFPFDKITSF